MLHVGRTKMVVLALQVTSVSNCGKAVLSRPADTGFQATLPGAGKGMG